MDRIIEFIKNYGLWFHWSDIHLTDLLEMFILAFAIYQIIIWIKKTRAWTLLKGLVVLLAICMIAVVMNMNVILWIFEKCIGVGITAVVIVFQPELRKALEQLGRKEWFKYFFSFASSSSSLVCISVSCVVYIFNPEEYKCVSAISLLISVSSII